MKLLKKQGLDESTTVAGHISLSPVSLQHQQQRSRKRHEPAAQHQGSGA